MRTVLNTTLSTPSGVPAMQRLARRVEELGRWTNRALRYGSAGRALAAACLGALLATGCGGGGDNADGTAAAAADADDTRVSALSASAGIDSVSTASATNWTVCASEGQTCAFSGRKLVRYGSGSTYTVLTFTGGTPCGNGVFGDPTPGVVKACAYADTTTAPAFDASAWTLCAAEGGSCAFTGTRQVRYGTTTQAVLLQVTSSTPCTNAVFGDPAVGTAKSCWVANPTTTTTAETWTACAQENQFCAFTGTRAVRYGSGTTFVSATFSGGVNCSNTVFGDPARGVVKSCSFSSIDTSAGAGTGAVVSGVTVPAVTASVLGVPLQLTATVSAQAASASSAAIAWTVADPTIATVSASGMVSPLRPGFTTVTATVGGKSATGTLTVRGPTPIPVRSQYVGTNVAGVAYYGSNFPFADLMKSGGGWGSNNNAPFPSVSADGYPTALSAGQKASAPVAWDGTNYPAGRYTVLWDGDGTISFPLSRIKIVETGPHRIVLEPTDTSFQMWVGIESTNPADPVRNVRFLLPGTESTYATQPFNPDYLKRIAPFSLLRFMDWGGTNGSPIVEWADRSLPTNATYTTSKGVPIEVMIDLANSLHVDPWFCIPHKASDDYVRQFGTLLHNRLDPTLRPHIEYSNEVWNTGFAQNAWAAQQSTTQGLSRPWGMPSIFYAKRAVQMFKILQSVYGSADSHRLVRVLGGQAAWTEFLQDALGYADTASNADVMAIAPYFNADSADNTANVDATLQLDASQIIDQMLVSVRGPIKSWMTSNGALAARYNLKMKAYESGPTDTTWAFPSDKQDPMLKLFSAANSNPRMKDLYVEYFTQWKAAGGDTMNQYVDVSAWSKWGLWGALQSSWQDVTTSPKYQGLMAFIAANPLTTQQTTLGASKAQ